MDGCFDWSEGNARGDVEDIKGRSLLTSCCLLGAAAVCLSTYKERDTTHLLTLRTLDVLCILFAWWW